MFMAKARSRLVFSLRPFKTTVGLLAPLSGLPVGFEIRTQQFITKCVNLSSLDELSDGGQDHESSLS